MPVYAVHPEDTWLYTPEACRDDPEPRTQFELGALTRREREQIADAVASVDGVGSTPAVSFRAGTTQGLYLRFGLRGWRHFTDRDGNPVEFRTNNRGGKRAVPTDDTLDRIPHELAEELAAAIERGSKLDDTTAGN